MSDPGHETSDRSVSCPRCGARTREGITPLGRVCENCSRRVFTPSSSATILLFMSGVLIVVTGILIGDGLSDFDPFIVVTAWVTFMLWGLAPSGSGNHHLPDWLRV